MHSTLPALRRRRQDAPSRRERPALETVAGELRGGDRLRQPAARRALGARLPETAERARADAARVVCRAAARCSRRWSARAIRPASCGIRLEDAAAEPSARQHLRLQHRRGARGEHDARSRAPARSATRWSTPRSTRSPTRCRRRPPGIDPCGRRQRRRASSARRSSRRSSICRSTARSRGGTVDAQALDRPVDVLAAPRRRSPTSPGLTGSRSSFRSLGEEQIVSHVMSRYETPWALNVRRLHVLWWAPALPPCGYAAFDLRVERAPKPVPARGGSAAKAAVTACLRVAYGRGW